MTSGQDRNYQSPQPVMSVSSPLTILADDLTGVCDAAVAFTHVCGPINVQINADNLSDVQSVQASTTESRDVSPAEAEARVRSIVERLPPATQLFKKIDSVFRGNTVVEIAATLRSARYDLAILAPAYPSLGRTIRQGVLHIKDAVTDRTIPVAELLANAGCILTPIAAGSSVEELTASLHSFLLNNSRPAVLCDATNHDDLLRIVNAVRTLGKQVLWIGSGGLAHALASQLPPLKPESTFQPRTGHAVFFIGSPHPVTRAQVDQLQSATHSTDRLIPVMLGETTAAQIRHAVAPHSPAQIGCLFMTGGDTAHFVCRALGIKSLRLQREFAPGVPLAIAEGGPFDGVSVILKSGGFGEPDLLCRLLKICRSEVLA